MTLDLTGMMLIATPAIGDPRFARSLIYICAHSDSGAFGLVVNRPVPMLRFGSVLEQIGIAVDPATADRPVLSGGPVETQRGFVLHSDDGADAEGRQRLPGGLALSASTEILVEIARGAGPADWVLALGYAGWGPGQLEAELAQNAWLTRPTDRALLFAQARGEAQWAAALRAMGIDPAGLSAQAGRA